MIRKLSVKNLYKIFGEDPERGLALLEQDKCKEEILEETGLAIGVQNASFEVEEGEIFVVMGLSGSGKSTLVRMLNGLITPTSGQILIDDFDIVTADDKQLREVRLNKVAMVFQHFALFPHKTVADNVAYGLKIKGLKASERYDQAVAALEQVGLKAYADSYPDQLSGGMQQRVGLARGLAVQPEILLMDEPFSALDPLIRKDMQDELLELQRTLKKTIVFITHDLNEALILGDRIAIMKEGRFVQVGTAEEIVGTPANDYVAAFTQDIDRSRVFDAGSIAGDPEALSLKSDADAALQRMEELGRNALYVLDGDRIAGLVTYRGIAATTRAGGDDGGLEPALIAEYPTTTAETQLNDLYPLASDGLPIAVVDERGSLTGVVETEAVFAQLAGDDRERGHDTEEQPQRA